jgi:cytochrome c553
MRRAHGLAVCAAALGAVLVAGTADAQKKPGHSASGAAPRGASAAAAAKPAGAAVYGQRFAALCAACHGANGRSDLPGTPVLAGQHSFYAITQLFLFREGRRGNEAMTAVAKTLTNDDLRGFSEFIGTLPPLPPPPAATPPDPVRMSKGRELARQHKCVFCHGDDFAGGAQVPRIAGQREDYLRDSLRGFKSGQRAGYTQAMLEAVSQVSVDELDTMAYYAANFPLAGAAAASASAPRSGASAPR